jgi:amidophosphoribosyltransferase
MGIAHCRYPTAGSADNAAEAQPFYVNSPFGLVLAHNGNLTNTEQLQEEMFRQDLRHINTNSDSEVLLNVLAHELQARPRASARRDTIFSGGGRRASPLQGRLRGGGDDRRLRPARLPRPLRHPPAGRRPNETPQGTEYLVASESVALDTLGFKCCATSSRARRCSHRHRPRACTRASVRSNPVYSPCMFEYVYLARPDSVIDGVSVYETRLRMGEHLADKVATPCPVDEHRRRHPDPDSSRPSAMQLAQRLGIPIREGFVKNRYIGRTFIMPGQATRKKSVRQKLNTIHEEFKGKRVLLVDDSIVRGTTSREIVEMARAAGALKVYFASAAPPGALPQRLRHRHADAQRADRHRPQRRRNRPRDRRRCADLPGSRRAQGLGARTQAVSPPSMPRASMAAISPATSAPSISTRSRPRNGSPKKDSEDGGASQQMHLNLMSAE